MKNQTIREAIASVLAESGRPMSARDVFEAIQRAGLYEFKAKDPANIVRSQLRRHCVNVKSPKGGQRKYFEMTADGQFRLLGEPVDVPSD